ncbi:MAG TPA: ParB N-terminal domain-containing protein [Nitrosospira sp.]|nr:ParB N-terminal domain-containing protein [Nitrosospira sp.]
MLCSLPIDFVPVDQIRPNECHYPDHAVTLADTILREQLWRVPVVLERFSLAVMDGHHRLEAARKLRLKYVPCLLLDYDSVEVDATRPGYVVNPCEIIRRARASDLYPPKTTRHRFPSPLPICNISLLLLEGHAAIAFPAASTRFSNHCAATTVEAANDRTSTSDVPVECRVNGEAS